MCVFIYIHLHRLMFSIYVYRDIFVIRLHTLLCFVSQAFISSQIFLPMLYSLNLQPEREKCPLIAHVCSHHPYFYSVMWMNWMLPGDIFWTCSILPSCRMVRKLKWGHRIHLLFCLDLLSIFLAFYCKESILHNELQK